MINLRNVKSINTTDSDERDKNFLNEYEIDRLLNCQSALKIDPPSASKIDPHS